MPLGSVEAMSGTAGHHGVDLDHRPGIDRAGLVVTQATATAAGHPRLP
jgi:hypothetical protein